MRDSEEEKVTWADEGQFISLTGRYVCKLDIPASLKGKVTVKVFKVSDNSEVAKDQYEVILEEDGSLAVNFKNLLGKYKFVIYADGAEQLAKEVLKLS